MYKVLFNHLSLNETNLYDILYLILAIEVLCVLIFFILQKKFLVYKLADNNGVDTINLNME